MLVVEHLKAKGFSMANEPEKASVADLTLERVRRLDASIDELKFSMAIQNQKLDALIDLASGTRADFSGFVKLYAAQEDGVTDCKRCGLD